jgi:cytochrome c oxidase subunit 1
MVPSPAPVHNFDQIPTVGHLDEFWHRKYGEDEDGRMVRIEPPPQTEGSLDIHRDDVHLPAPSYFPMVASFGLLVIAYAMLYRNYPVAVVGALVMLGGIYAWGLEPSSEPHDDHGHDDGGGHDGHDGDGPAGVDTAVPDEAVGVNSGTAEEVTS